MKSSLLRRILVRPPLFSKCRLSSFRSRPRFPKRSRIFRLDVRASTVNHRQTEPRATSGKAPAPSPLVTPIKGSVNFLQLRSFLEFSRHVGRGVGQVVFAETAVGGGVLLAVTWLGGTAVTPAMGLVGAGTATFVGRVLKAETSQGLYGFNGTLMGVIFSHFLFPSPTPLALLTLSSAAGGALCAVTQVAMTRYSYPFPILTIPFNLLAVGCLSFVRPLHRIGEMAVDVSPSVIDCMLSPICGIGQIVVSGTPLAGAGVLLTMTIGHFSDPRATNSAEKFKNAATSIAAAVGGSGLGCLTAYGMGAEIGDIVSGLHGFNPCLTALALATFYHPSKASLAVIAGGSIATSALTVAVSDIFSAMGTPFLTIPFCVVVTGVFGLSRLGGIGEKIGLKKRF
ncbi:hypothetical protein AAMO2058_000532200 [Amorphochlora amoebiformis]